MYDVIADGKGSGSKAEVDSSNRLKVFSTSEPQDKSLNRLGYQWSAYFTVTPAAGAKYFFYFKNTGVNDVLISDIRITCAAAESFTYDKVSGVATGGSALTPTNRNFGSNNVVTGTIETGTDITGLTNEGTVFFETVTTANSRQKLSTTSNIIIPNGTSIALKTATGGNLVTCVVSLTEEVS